MFDFLTGPTSRIDNAAMNAYQPQKSFERELIDTMAGEINALQKIVDAVCKVYVAEHAKDISARDPDERFFRTDQPIIDRAKLLELRHKITVAEMELKELRKRGGFDV